MGNRLEKLLSGGGDGDWARPQRKIANSHKYCHHNLVQCQICRKHQQQCHTCSAYEGAENALALLHVSSTPNLGGGYNNVGLSYLLYSFPFFLLFWFLIYTFLPSMEIILETTLPPATPLDLRSSSFSYGVGV